MESLGQLNTALPPNELAEQALASSFRQAALSITALFKQGKRATSKAYIGGQRQALQEVLEFMQAMLDQPGTQAGTSTNGSLAAGTSGANLAASLGQVDGARLINFICARQEALKAEEEDCDEDDASGPGSAAAAPPPRRAASAAPAAPSAMRPSMAFGSRSEDATRPASPTPRGSPAPDGTTTAAAPGASAPPSPTSSIAFSPPFTRSNATLFRPTTLAPAGAPAFTHAHSAPPASPSPLSTSMHHGNPPSPLGRPSRLHRDHHHHGHRTRTSSRTSGAAAGPGPKAGPSASGLPGSVSVDDVASAGVKRRWAWEAMGVGAIGGAAEDGEVAHRADHVVEVHPSADREDAGGMRSTGMEVETMADMEGWDGVGERPSKRMMRTARTIIASDGSADASEAERGEEDAAGNPRAEAMR
ncbi:hypothetical protein JCM8202_004179 [Rhodotorula sphaerocarpa]